MVNYLIFNGCVSPLGGAQLLSGNGIRQLVDCGWEEALQGFVVN